MIENQLGLRTLRELCDGPSYVLEPAHDVRETGCSPEVLLLQAKFLPDLKPASKYSVFFILFGILTSSVVVGVQDGCDRCCAIRRLDGTFIIPRYNQIRQSSRLCNDVATNTPLKLFRSKPLFGLLSHKRRLFVLRVLQPGMGTS